MNYLTRPVFLFAPNWADAVSRDLNYDLRVDLIGFGAEFFTPTATYSANAWDFALFFETPDELIAFEEFTDALTGRVNGFWLPCPLQAAVITAGVDTSHFKIVTEGLADTWNSRPDQHLFFTFADGTQAAGKINGVVDNGDGTETVTLTAALAAAPDATTIVQRLHFVRFVSDEESFTFNAEGIASIKLTVVELPLEYTAAATGLQPIHLYHLWAKAPVGVDWYFTSFAAGVVSNGKLHSPFPMSHGAIKQTVDGQSQTVSIEAQPDPAHPFALLAGTPPGRALWIEISLCYFADPDTATQLFSGFVTNVSDDGGKLTAKCESRLAWLRTKTPRFLLGTTCNWNLYDVNTCRVARAHFETTVTIVSLAGSPPVVAASFDFGFDLARWQRDDWFTGGIFEVGLGVQYEVRSIIASSWDGAHLQLVLNQALKHAGAGAKAQITAGCDHTANGANGCKLKFNNFQHFSGFEAIPQRNLSLMAIESTSSQGGKK
jgi:uncharacterized phage protein (TIGR02218 family)